MDYYEAGDTVHRSRKYAEARKIRDPVVIIKTGRHKVQRVILSENALARVERKLRWVK